MSEKNATALHPTGPEGLPKTGHKFPLSHYLVERHRHTREFWPLAKQYAVFICEYRKVINSLSRA